MGLAVAIAVLGPALGRGPLLGLDLVVPPDLQVPRGIWGLGPDLPRRVPLGVVLVWGSAVVGGPLIMKALFVLCIGVAFVGAWRLAFPAPNLCRLGAGLLYALSPFVLTRLGVGHWMLVATIALLPWALPHLLRPGDDLARTFLWAAALGGTGVNGGIYGAVLVAIGVTADKGRGAARIIPLFLLAQLPWLAPGVIVMSSGPDLPDPTAFATEVGAAGPLGLVLGGGFWRQSSQVGNVAGPGPVLLALTLLGLAVVGARHLPPGWQRRARAAALIGLATASASAVPGVARLYADFAATPVGAPLRDGQRMLALFLVWLAPAAASGAWVISHGLKRARARMTWLLPAGAALVLAAPALWGIGGALEPAPFPVGWNEARREVLDAPGTLLALPWHEYLDLGFAGDRRVFNPVPDFFGGDVLWSSDPELGSPSREQADPREPSAAEVARQLRLGRPQSAALAQLGVRWVVLLHEVDWGDYTSLTEDRGLERVVDTDALDLYRVRDWQGPFVDDSGTSVPSRSFVSPLVSLDASPAVTWRHPAAPGWLRGTTSAERTASGQIRLPAGSGPVWYWPAALTLVAHGLTIAGVGIAARSLRPSRSGHRPRRIVGSPPPSE